jgi:ribosomal protein S21
MVCQGVSSQRLSRRSGFGIRLSWFFGFFVPRGRVSRIRRTLMGVRIVVAVNEPAVLALNRFKRLLERHGVNWELRKRGFLLQPNGCTFQATATRRAKKFQKRLKARKETLLAKIAGKQPSDSSASDLRSAFWERTGEPRGMPAIYPIR